MRPLHKIILFLLLLLCCTCDEPKIETPPLQTYNPSVIEVNMLELLNDYRSEHNLQTVTEMNHISALAYEHNLWMIQNHQVNHSYFYARASNIEQVFNVERIGEIIAYNYITNSSALSAWIDSPMHAAVLDDNHYGYVGISITQDTITSRKYYTVIFAGN
jgi:uncharacterized protein YkwD